MTGYTVLFRAHYLIANAFDFERFGDFVIDVSQVNDINDLYVISDVLVTDYSSVFFDYANLRRPIIFYMYDLDRYANDIRGFYLGLDELPGPIVQTEDELVVRLNDAETPTPEDIARVQRVRADVRALRRRACERARHRTRDCAVGLPWSQTPLLNRKRRYLNEACTHLRHIRPAPPRTHPDPQRAKDLGDYLVVAVSTDEFNEGKGKKAYHDYELRKEIVESIRYVDLVIPENSWDQKIDDIKRYDIDIVVMGDDWADSDRFDYLKDYCELVFLPRTEGISTTEIKADLSKAE